MDRVSMYSVKAAFVIGIYLMPSSVVGASYLYMGLALGKALALGLQHESEEPDIDSREREIRRRLWWAIFSLERTLTIKLNRPRSISQDVFTTHLPQRRATDALQSFDNLDHQVANARFVKITDTLIEPATWSSNSQPPLQDFEVSLKAWKRSLPPKLRLPNVEPRSPYYRAFALWKHSSIAEEARAKVRPFGSAQFDASVNQEASEYLLWTDWLNRTAETSGTTAGDVNDPSPMWEEAAALLQLRNPSTPNQPLAVEDNALSTSAAGLPEESPFDLGLDIGFPPATFAENHMQLMDLTGMDMLDFTFDI
ncbi:thiamine repressible genes regulatory protein thi1 [Colletotrichum salicis]|uniref:Thiamine repressible genes regulatory protein thi1 n=1 Tax=Colletotrichum salicis TaxID=1209931 RepID=A0A135ULJ2_9PEZI|nr:thiamine repressible genes regulatory protein thi1 [Colletotrichum salicis]